MRRSVLVGLAVVSSLGCAPATGAFEAQVVEGRVVDRESGEPVRGAWVVEWVLGRALPGATPPERAARFERSDASGRVRFVPTSVAGTRSYTVFHPAYGMVHARPPEAGGTLAFTLSLRDSALRMQDRQPYCSGQRSGEGARRLAAIACARTFDASFVPRAHGERDANGTRIGEWRFEWEDGSLAARGRYERGAAVGEWEHWDRRGRKVE